MINNIVKVNFIKHEKYWTLDFDIMTKEVIWNDSENICNNAMQLTDEEKKYMENQVIKWIKLNEISRVCLN
jgi:hypothetical protein